MATETITIPLTNGNIEGTDYFVGDEDDTQYVTLTDGGALTNVHIAKFGKDTPTETGEGDGGDDEFYLDLSGFNDDFNITVMSLDPGDTFYISGALSWSNVGNVYTISYIGSDSSVHTLVIDVESTNGTGVAGIVITCFAAGMEIETEAGIVAVEHLGIGDNVRCGDGRFRPIRWISKRHVSAREMARNPEFRPVRIRKNALGENIPNADLVVSPQHRIMIDDWRAELMFGEVEVLVSAVHLLNDNDIVRDYDADDVTYYHFMFDEHQTVWSNGVQSESFFPGETAIKGIDEDARVELYQLFPELAEDPRLYGSTCLPDLKAYEAHAMLGL